MTPLHCPKRSGPSLNTLLGRDVVRYQSVHPSTPTSAGWGDGLGAWSSKYSRGGGYFMGG